MAHTKVQTVGDHVKELQLRLLWVVLVFLVGGFAGYEYHVKIITFLTQFLHGSSLYYSNPAGGFNFIMKVSVLVGAVAAIPLLVYQVIKFAEPAIEKRYRYKRVWTIALLSLFLALGGIAFGLGLIVPVSLHFFAGFKVSGLQPLLSADEYLNYVIKVLTWFAALFQIPLLVLFINRITPLHPRKLLRYEKFVIVGSLIIALILPFTYDPVTQLIIAVPIILLYNLSIVFVWYANRVPRTKSKMASGAQAVGGTKVGRAQSHTPQPHRTAPQKSRPIAAQAYVSNRPVQRRPVHDITPRSRPSRPVRPAPARPISLEEKPQYAVQPRPVVMDIIVPEA